MKRRNFIHNTGIGALGVAMAPIFGGCQAQRQEDKELKISLAQWSLHRSFEKGELDPVDFASIAIEKYRLKAIEYVNGFYIDHATDEVFWNDMNTRAADAGVKNLLIMVDDEGDLGTANEKDRKTAVENHYKWINAARILGCHSIRVNAFGDPDLQLYKNAIVDAMGQLTDYAAKEGINIIIENHGLYSSNAKIVAEVIRQVDKPNFGSFPDFGNWCLSAKWGSTQIPCENAYDRYQGVAELLPYAKAVSAKSYNFNENGEDRIIDYYKLLKIVKESEYDGYIGIEYEGTEISEHEGILATKRLMEKVWKT